MLRFRSSWGSGGLRLCWQAAEGSGVWGVSLTRPGAHPLSSKEAIGSSFSVYIQWGMEATSHFIRWKERSSSHSFKDVRPILSGASQRRVKVCSLIGEGGDSLNSKRKPLLVYLEPPLT